MSIINEALKKTEEKLQKQSVKNTPSPDKPSKVNPFLLYALILSAGLLAGNFIFNLINHKIRNSQPLPKETTPAASPAVKIPPPILSPEQTPKEEKPTEVSFILNGIVYSDNDGYALINNQIVRENDYVDGAKVNLINTNTVELDNAGQVITLTTGR
ncbi:MAG: hypothetical protein PHS66_07360 [Candidatus Omnitrophica bacterium]|nr:hypothetical protein [Candidatus Omnitrophota bacterium]